MSNKRSKNINILKVTFSKTHPFTRECVVLLQEIFQNASVLVSPLQKTNISTIQISIRRKMYPEDQS